MHVSGIKRLCLAKQMRVTLIHMTLPSKDSKYGAFKREAVEKPSQEELAKRNASWNENKS